MDLLAADGDLLRLLVVAVLGGWLVLDDTAWAQTWISQPLPAGLLAGLAAGGGVRDPDCHVSDAAAPGRADSARLGGR